MSRSSAGGAAASGGETHQARCFAWAATYLLAEKTLPDWASGQMVVVAGAQTERPVDDVGIVTDNDGWVMIQAKKGLRLEAGADSELAKALGQLVQVAVTGVPEARGMQSGLRPVDPARDRVIIVADGRASAPVRIHLSQVAQRLQTLPKQIPIAEAARNADDRRALGILRTHLDHAWRAHRGGPLSDDDFRGLCRLLDVRALHLLPDEVDARAAQMLLAEVIPSPNDVLSAWEFLVAKGHQVAEERGYIDRATLIHALETERDIVLRPAAQLRPDIERLLTRTDLNLDLLARNVAIDASDAVVSVRRTIGPVLAEATGSIAITGDAGSGKSVLLQNLAVSLRSRSSDVVVLRAEDLRGTAGDTRSELNLQRDLRDLLTGWPGRGEATLVIDGLDQTRGEDPSSWIADLAHALRQTRWRIVATIRTYDLKHGIGWRQVFPGDPVSDTHKEAGLRGVRHVLVRDFDNQERDQVRAQSPQLSAILTGAGQQLSDLLANPFNLNVAAKLIDADGEVLETAVTRIDLLDTYWRERMYRDDVTRLSILRSVVERMVSSRRQSVSVAAIARADNSSLTGLSSDGVLRSVSASAGHPTVMVEFSHPVLFDYTVAQLALGDTSEPMSLADVLGDEPNLVITVRPSLQYRLAIAWRADDTRNGFWDLTLRLMSRTSGHVLAALEATRVVAHEIQAEPDCARLVDACTGNVTDLHDRWTTEDARGLAFLLAASVGRHTGNPRATGCIAGVTRDLAAHARQSNSTELALLAAQLPQRILGKHTLNGTEVAAWIDAAVDCASIALDNPEHQVSQLLVEFTSRSLTEIAATDTSRVRDTLLRMVRPELLSSWGEAHLRAPVDRLGDIARIDPNLAVEIGASLWALDKVSDETTYLTRSAILPLTSTRRQDLDSARHAVGNRFSAVADANLLAATSLLLRVVETPSMYRWDSSVEFDTPPRPRIGEHLDWSRGHGAPMAMTRAWVARVQALAEAVVSDRSDSSDKVLLGEVINMVVADLRHAEVWERLLHCAATAERTALAHALLPALTSPNLYVMPNLWVTGAHVLQRLSPELTPADHAAIEKAVLSLDVAGRGTSPETDARLRSDLPPRANTIVACLRPEKLQQDEARHRANVSAAELPPLTNPSVRPIARQVQPNPSEASAEFDIAALITQSDSDDGSEADPAAQKLAELWSAERDANDNPALSSEDQLRIAQRLSTEPETLPGTPQGDSVFAALRAAMPDPADPGTAEMMESWSELAGYGQTPATCALGGLVHLASRPEWRDAHHDDLRRLLSPFLDSRSPVYRYITTHALPCVVPDSVNTIDELNRRILAEVDSNVLDVLLRLLIRNVRTSPEAVDATIEQFASRPLWMEIVASESDNRRFDRVAETTIGLTTHLALVHQTNFASNLLESWFSSPTENPAQLQRAVEALRSVLNTADARHSAAQERAFKLLEIAANACREHLETLADQQQEVMSDIAKVAETISSAIYFASGALDDIQPTELAPRGDQTRFAQLALTVLRLLVAVRHPAVTRHVVQTIRHICDRRPREALLTVSEAVVNDTAYTRDALALDDALTLTKHYLVDYRQLLQEDPACLTAVRQLLEVYVRGGWEQALELTEDLDLLT